MKLNLKNSLELHNSEKNQITQYDIYKITGDDKFTFLQGQITNDVELLKKNKSIGTVYCNIKGRIIGNFFLHLTKIDNIETIILINPGDNGKNLFKSLKKYSLFSKVKIEKITDQYDLFLTKKNQDTINITLGEKELSFKIEEKKEKPQINSKWKLFFIDAKMPIINKEQNEEFLSHNLELPKLGVINFKKGCYLGQEIIARTEYKAKLKKSCVILSGEIHNDIETLENYTLTNNDSKKIGEVINYEIDNGKIFILASIDKQFLESDIILNKD